MNKVLALNFVKQSASIGSKSRAELGRCVTPPRAVAGFKVQEDLVDPFMATLCDDPSSRIMFFPR